MNDYLLAVLVLVVWVWAISDIRFSNKVRKAKIKDRLRRKKSLLERTKIYYEEIR